jgi:hypothetical protein
VRPSEVRAARKSASTATSVSTPLSEGIDATGSGVADADDEVSELEDPLSLEPMEQAASEKLRRPAAAIPTVTLAMLRMFCLLPVGEWL